MDAATGKPFNIRSFRYSPSLHHMFKRLYLRIYILAECNVVVQHTLSFTVSYGNFEFNHTTGRLNLVMFPVAWPVLISITLI